MSYQIRNDIVTKVSTCCLIEDIQNLREAMAMEDWDSVRVTIECLEYTVANFTTVPEDLQINPSGSSPVAMSCQEGVIVDDSGNDLRCANGLPMSDATADGVCVCPDDCPHREDCAPEEGKILLDGFCYQPNSMEDEAFLDYLEKSIIRVEAE